MPVGKDRRPAVFKGQNAIRGADGEFEHEGIHLAVAVSPHAEEAVLHAVEQFCAAEGGIFARQRVARAVVEKIAEQNDLGGVLLFYALRQKAAVIGGTVDVRGNEEFHRSFKISFILAITPPSLLEGMTLGISVFKGG